MSFPTTLRRLSHCNLLLVALCVLLFATACTTESANRTATVEAGGTAVTTLTPAGNLLMIDEQAVQSVYVPDPRQQALYAQTEERLYIWRNRQWEATATESDHRTILVDQNEPERLFRGNHPACAQSDEEHTVALEVSEDSGETWRRLPNGDNIRPMAIDPVFADVLYGTDCSLTISNTLGETWRYFEPVYEHEVVDLVVVGERVLVLGISSSGKSQIRELRMTNPDEVKISDIIVQMDGIACVDADADRIVVGGPTGVEISLDGGESWAESRHGLESVTIPPDENLVAPNNPSSRPEREFGILTIAIDPARSHRVFAGTVRGLYISQDDGGTWDRYDEIASDTPVHDIQFASNGADIYVTTGDGVVTVPNP